MISLSLVVNNKEFIFKEDTYLKKIFIYRFGCESTTFSGFVESEIITGWAGGRRQQELDNHLEDYAAALAKFKKLAVFA